MLDVNWARPDRVKSSGVEQTLDMLALDVIREGYADSKAEAVKYIRQRVPAESKYQKDIMAEIKNTFSNLKKRTILTT